MWICQRCHAENRDTARVCPTCGTVRAAGRFNAAPPRVTVPQVPPMQDPPQTMMPESMPVEKPPRRRRRKGGLARLAGWLLCLLLPGLTLLLAWQQQETVLSAVVPLFTSPAAPGWLGYVCYGALTLSAFLLALLPGLWTLLLSRKTEG